MYFLIGVVFVGLAYVIWRFKRIEWLYWVLTAMGWATLGVGNFHTSHFVAAGYFFAAAIHLWRATRKYGTDTMRKAKPKPAEAAE